MQENNKEKWYSNSIKRWQKAEANLYGIMDGFVDVNKSDVDFSCALIKHLIDNKKLNNDTVIDCAAGIGRVSENVLQNFFNKIDIVERDEKFVEACKKTFASNEKIRNIFCDSLENFEFRNNYDLIWIQWCLEEILYDDLIIFLKRCKSALKQNGIIIVKENILNSAEPFLEDSNREFRSVKYLCEIFDKCDLNLESYYMQPNWPQNLFPVATFVLKAR